MPITLKSTGGGSVSIDVPATGSTYTLTAPANNGTIFTTAGGNITGNVSINGTVVSPFGSMKNRIINGDFRIDQRFCGAANNNIAGAGQMLCDRWYVSCGGGSTGNKLRFQQNNTNGPGSAATQVATGLSTYYGANVVSSNTVNTQDAWSFGQVIEGYNIADFNWGTSVASSATLSFWVYSSIAGTHGATILNSTADRSYPFTYTISAANTWQFQTVTIPGDTTGSYFSNNGVGLYVVYNYGIGTYFAGTNNTWNAGQKYPANVVNPISSANGSLYLTGVQLEKGSQATSWDWRHFQTELALCQRYYEKSYEVNVPPGTIGANGVQNYVQLTIAYVNGGGAPISYRVTKRVVPTVVSTYSTNSGTIGKMYDNTTSVDINSSIASIGVNGMMPYGSFTTGSGLNLTLHWTANADFV